jgi:hypothetical protein
MIPWAPVLSVTHLIGLALAVGSATVKLILLFRCRSDPGFAPTFLAVSGPITRQIILGMVLLTLSGIGWMLLGYGFTPRLIVKLALFAAIWILGPLLDNVLEPRFKKLAPAPGKPATPAYAGALKQVLAWELVATSLFYVIVVLWVFRP